MRRDRGRSAMRRGGRLRCAGSLDNHPQSLRDSPRQRWRTGRRIVWRRCSGRCSGGDDGSSRVSERRCRSSMRMSSKLHHAASGGVFRSAACGPPSNRDRTPSRRRPSSYDMNPSTPGSSRSRSCSSMSASWPGSSRSRQTSSSPQTARVPSITSSPYCMSRW